MLTPTERELARAAVAQDDDSVAQVVADALTERGEPLGEFMLAAMSPLRDLPRERALLPSVSQALRGAGLKWAEQLAFRRGLPVAARAEALRVFRLSDAQTLAWPLEELWLEGSEVGAFFAALGTRVMERISRLTLDGSILSPYTMFVSGAPAVLQPLQNLRWVRPPDGEIPEHWVPVFLPAFAAVRVLCIGPGVDLPAWLEATPRLETLEVRLAEPPDPNWAREVVTLAARRRLKVLVNGVEVTSLDGLVERGLVAARPEPEERAPPIIQSLDDASPPVRPGDFVEAFSGRSLRLLSPQRDSWTRFNWRQEVYTQLERLLTLGPAHGVTRVVRVLANPARAEVTFGHELQRLEVTPADAPRRSAELRAALLALHARDLHVPALTRDMIYRRGDELEIFPVTDHGLVDPWPSAPRLVGLPLLPEHHRCLRGLELLVQSVTREWTLGHPIAPVSLEELALRREWRTFSR